MLQKLVKSSWRLYKPKVDETTIQNSLQIINNFSWIIFLIYFFIIKVISEILITALTFIEYNYVFVDIDIPEISNSISSYSLSGHIIEFLAGFLISLVFIYVGFYLINRLFKAAVSFSDFFKIVMYVSIPVALFGIIVLLIIIGGVLAFPLDSDPFFFLWFKLAA